MDGKTDKFTCLMKDVTVPSGEKKKKRVFESEHHLVFMQESGSNKGNISPTVFSLRTQRAQI